MSGVWKGIKKAFRKTVKAVKKVLPAALAIGAVVFTVGGAMGVPGMAGGWGGAVSRLTGSLGAGETLTNVLTGALTQAGYGAVLGAGTSLLTGGDLSKGAGIGALGDAATGGLMGGMGMQTDPLAGMTGGTPASSTAAPNGNPINLNPANGPTGVQLPSATSAGITAPASSGGLIGPGGWLERNQTLAGSAIKGLGTGLMSMAEGGDLADAGELALKRDREERAAIAANYGTGDVSGFRSAANPTGNPTPAQRFDPATYRYEFRYDPAQGRIVKVPTDA